MDLQRCLDTSTDNWVNITHRLATSIELCTWLFATTPPIVHVRWGVTCQIYLSNTIKETIRVCVRSVISFVCFVCHTQLQKSLMRSWEEVGVVWRAVRFGKGKKKIFMLKIFLPKIFSTKIFSPKNIFLMLMNIPKDHRKSQYSETRKPRYIFLKASGRSSQ